MSRNGTSNQNHRTCVRLPSDYEAQTGQRWPRWEQIQYSLSQTIDSSYKLENAIKAYNPTYASVWSFSTLHELFKDRQFDSRRFFKTILPKIIKIALQLQQIVPNPIQLLKRGATNSVTLTQQQVACLLANAFLCTFPHRNTTQSYSEYSNYPTINFSNLYGTKGRNVIEKLKCICHYFDRVLCLNMPNNYITFQRRCIDSHFEWEKSNVKISRALLDVRDNGKIEDAHEMLQVDFANCFVGGGILGRGSVQEEIRFSINPEMIVARLFTEGLEDNETLLMIGCERFSSYRGYADSFEWNGDFQDATPVDYNSQRNCRVVAIDALKYQNNREQFQEKNIKRELNKVYCGFYRDDLNDTTPVASGLLGCGVFKGHPLRSALIQLMACAVLGRDLAFYAFGNVEVQRDIDDIYKILLEKDVSVGQLYKILLSYGTKNDASDPTKLVKFIKSEFKENKAKQWLNKHILRNKPVDGLCPTEQDFNNQQLSTCNKMDDQMDNEKNMQTNKRGAQHEQEPKKRSRATSNSNDNKEVNSNRAPDEKLSNYVTQNVYHYGNYTSLPQDDINADNDALDEQNSTKSTDSESVEAKEENWMQNYQPSHEITPFINNASSSLTKFSENIPDFKVLLGDVLMKFFDHHRVNINEMILKINSASNDQERVIIMSKYISLNGTPNYGDTTHKFQ